MLLTRSEEILFLPPHNLQAEIFTGPKTAAEDADAVEKSRIREGSAELRGRIRVSETDREIARHLYASRRCARAEAAGAGSAA